MAYLRHMVVGATSLFPSRIGGFRAASSISFSKEVLQAKSEGQPIVSLESTIITHGMPYPQNLETARQVENIIRDRVMDNKITGTKQIKAFVRMPKLQNGIYNLLLALSFSTPGVTMHYYQGATPATVAILKGQLTVGLSESQLEYLAKSRGVVKASRRDLAAISAAKLDGATTVAGTIVAAELADIPIFVTGGIGGVHRDGENTLDISADLNELGRSKTMVVCSGVKSILDIGRTLEYLETQGVCVCSYGDSDEFPAFYTRRSGHRAPHRLQDAAHAARLLHTAHLYKLRSGIVVAVPVPEEHATDEKLIEEAIKKALEEAKRKHIGGKEITPFILSEVAKVTGGASLAANIALVKNNAKIGADIAVEFHKLKNADNLNSASNIGFSKSESNRSPNTSRKFHTSCIVPASNNIDSANKPILPGIRNSDGDVLVIGGANVDRTYRVTEDDIQLDGSTHACSAAMCGGGVARNMAEALWRLRDSRVKLLTAIGDDADGKYINDIAPGLLLDGCIIKGGSTPSYAAVLDARGECRLGLGDMGLHNHITVEMVNKHIEVLRKAPIVVLDGNAPQPTIDHVLRVCHELQKPGKNVIRCYSLLSTLEYLM